MQSSIQTVYTVRSEDVNHFKIALEGSLRDGRPLSPVLDTWVGPDLKEAFD